MRLDNNENIFRFYIIYKFETFLEINVTSDVKKLY